MEPNKVPIALNGEFSAVELEEIIATLAEVRAGMGPAVPSEPPSLLSDREVLVQEEAEWRIRRLANGGLRIWLRNEGSGWLAFTVSPSHAEGLREFLGKKGRDGANH